MGFETRLQGVQIRGTVRGGIATRRRRRRVDVDVVGYTRFCGFRRGVVGQLDWTCFHVELAFDDLGVGVLVIVVAVVGVVVGGVIATAISRRGGDAFDKVLG